MKKTIHKTNLLCNPFFIYIFSFTFVFIVYFLNWSGLYPKITTPTFLFFLVSFICSTLLGYYFRKKDMPRFIASSTPDTSLKWHLYFAILLSISEFLYSRNIPLLSAIAGAKYGEDDFGVPSLHVFIVAYTSFIATYIYYYYLNRKSKKHLFFYILLLSFPVLELSRSYILFILISTLFIYLQYKGTEVYKTLIKVSFWVIISLSVFGYLGNIRSTNDIEKYSDSDDINDLILTVGEASESFRNSPIPKVYFWAYLYISSPLANLQETIDKTDQFFPFDKAIMNFAQRQLLWDVLSKRLEPITQLKDEHFKQITPPLTVGTTFAESYTYLGWLGIILMYIYITIIVLLYLLLLKDTNKYYVVGVSILNTIVLLGIFDNMIILTQLSMQLLFPFILRIRFVKSLSIHNIPSLT